jgi:ethanolamine transporter EutH
MITAVEFGKLAAGVLAILLCIWMSRELSEEIAQSKAMSLVASAALPVQ